MKTCPGCGLLFPNESTFCFLDGQTLEASSDDMIGSTLVGRFRLQAVIAETPWARVYRARHRLLDVPCTVKLVRESLTDAQRKRFLDAVALARRCTHPNVGELLGGGLTAEAVPYLVQRCSDAEPLAQLLQRGRMQPERAVGLTMQLLRALGRIHDFGVIHGDLRPSNVLCSAQDHVEVIDVGLGRSLLREPWEDDPASLVAQCYLAPELSSKQRVSAPADIYAVGVMCFQMICGRLPIEANDSRQLRAELSAEPTPLAPRLPGLAEQVVAWLERMLARAQPDRPANAHQALDELEEACTAAGLAAQSAPGPAQSNAEAPLDPSFARWQRYRGVFNKMMEIGFPSGAPDHTRNAYESIQGRCDQLEQVAKKGRFEHGNLSDIATRAGEGRQRIADQMGLLNADASEIRRELQPLLVAAGRHGEKAQAFPQKVIDKHREVVQWEGRSGFFEPYKELADAYRSIADLMEKWWSVRNAQLTCEQDAADKREKLVDLEAQLEALRESLRVHESNLSAEIEACEGALAQLGNEADKLEMELLDLASRFSAPLRSKPELGACFRELTAPA